MEFSCAVFSDVPGSRKSSENTLISASFRQKFGHSIPALAYKIPRFCLVPLFASTNNVELSRAVVKSSANERRCITRPGVTGFRRRRAGGNFPPPGQSCDRRYPW